VCLSFSAEDFSLGVVRDMVSLKMAQARGDDEEEERGPTQQRPHQASSLASSAELSRRDVHASSMSTECDVKKKRPAFSPTKSKNCEQTRERFRDGNRTDLIMSDSCHKECLHVLHVSMRRTRHRETFTVQMPTIIEAEDEISSNSSSMTDNDELDLQDIDLEYGLEQEEETEIERQHGRIESHYDNKREEEDELEQRRKDFEHARTSRQRHSDTVSRPPVGIYGLYKYVTHLRTDIAWVERTSEQRAEGETPESWKIHVLFDGWETRLPWFSWIFAFLCTIMLVISIAMNGWKLEKLSANPMLGPSFDVLLDLGALMTERIVDYNEWHRLVMPVILHAGLIHFALNMMVLFFFGPMLERVHGSIRVGTVFLVSAVGANIASAVFTPPIGISVGASGGLCALLGMCLADAAAHKELLGLHKDERRPFSCWSCILWLCLELGTLVIMGLTPWIDQFAHVGGLFYGFCFGAVMNRSSTKISWRFLLHGKTTETRWRQHLVMAAKLFGLALAVALWVSTTIFLARADSFHDLPCRECQYLSCVPVKWWQCDSCDTIEFRVRSRPATGSAGGLYLHSMELKCPLGDRPVLALPSTSQPAVDMQLLREEVGDLCRNYCDEQ
jgi:membrane associated rhomboid family serine protease